MKRIGELCARLELPPRAERKLEALLKLLTTDRAAPTSVTSPGEVVDRHFADSLAVLPLLRDRPPPETIVDIGTGAGLPGLPLAVALPDAEVDLLEATRRKCEFIERAIERLDQRNARVVCARAEDWAGAEGEGRYALVTVRAVAPLATLVEYASPLLREGGLLVAWKGARDTAQERAGAAVAAAIGMESSRVERVEPFPGARHRHLHLYEKVAPTPAGIPRRPGQARKRPFGL